MQDDRGFSFFGGADGRLPGFNLGDDNVPPSVKFEREELARRKKEEQERKKLDEEDDLAARKCMKERLRKDEEEERQRAQQRGDPNADWDDENYRTPPQYATGTRVSPPPTAESAGRPCATGSPPLAARATSPRAPEREPRPESRTVHPTTAESAGETRAANSRLPVAHTPRLANERNPNNNLPLWQKLSGLWPKQEAKMDRNQRRESIRKLRKEYEHRIRASLDEYECEQRKAADPSPQPPSARGGGADTAESAEDRTFLWSPLDAICNELSIARRKLSAYMRELTGMSAQEVIDKIKAEKIARRLKEKLAARAKEEYETHFANAGQAYRKSAKPKQHDAYKLGLNLIPAEQLEREKMEAKQRIEIGMNCEPKCGWASAAGGLCSREWESRRAQPSIAWAENARYAARQQFARELGFSNYNRLYRACLLAFGKTVMELEHAAALELLQALDKEAAPRREAVKAEVLASGT